MHCGVIIVAAGGSTRMGGLDKTLATIAGREAIQWVFDAVDAVDGIEEVVLVTSDRNRHTMCDLIARRSLRVPYLVCMGGETRQQSVFAGLQRLSASVDLVLIHDAARVLVTPELIERGIAMGEDAGAVVAAIPIADTVKRVRGDGTVLETLDRGELRAVQTPQVFRRDWLQDAFSQSEGTSLLFTDEASLLEWAGYPVRVFPGAVENLKLTTRADFALAGALLAVRGGSDEA